jgi:hypothetical protein
MKNKRLNHNLIRDIICLVCFRKCKTLRFLTDIQKNIIKQKLINFFDESDIRFPRKICNTCSFKIKKFSLAKDKLQIYDYNNYDSTSINAMNENCSCELCKVGKLMPINIIKKNQ